MKNFLKMIDAAKNGIMYDDGVVDRKCQTFWDAVSSSEIFVFTPKNEFTQDVEDVRNETVDRLDAPFRVFSFELTGSSSLTSLSADERRYVAGEIETLCIMCVEINPREYNFFMLARATPLAFGEIKYGVLWSKPNDSRYEWCKKITDIYLERLAREVSGVEEVREKVKIGTGKNKKFRKISRVIHIMPKKERDKIIGISNGQSQIDWSHRWSVRGHWRRVGGIGKDRDGNYCVEGMTWVSEHEKGPDDLPLIKKQRVVE